MIEHNEPFLRAQGEWKCVATNSFGEGVSSCRVFIKVPRQYKIPLFLEPLRVSLTKEGTVNLECKVSLTKEGTVNLKCKVSLTKEGTVNLQYKVRPLLKYFL